MAQISGDGHPQFLAGIISPSGVVLNSSGGFSAARLSVGRYRITFTVPMISNNYPVVSTVVEAYTSRDSIDARVDGMTNQSFDVHVTEGDNGGAANTPRDRSFSFMVYGS